MTSFQSYPYPEVFLVDRGQRLQPSDQPPALIPCWSSMPSPERLRAREKKQGFMRVNGCLVMVVLMLFLLVFAALGFGAYQIHKMQKELGGVTEVQPEAPQKQIGVYEPRVHEEDKPRSAAHMIGRIEKRVFHETLRWEPKVGRAFTSGAVTYSIEDGALQVNESGIYHIYSQVEVMFRSCSSTSFIHKIFVRRKEHSLPLTLMVAHRTVPCPLSATSHFWMSSSYLGSSMKLQNYDRVYVNISHPANLSHENYANFFGLYKI